MTIDRATLSATIMSLPEAKQQPIIAGILAKAASSLDEAKGVLAAAQTHAVKVAAQTHAASTARRAEAKANVALFNKMTGRARPVVEDKRPPVSGAAASARAFGDAQRRARGLPPRTGI